MNELHSFGWYAARLKPYLPKKAFNPVPARLWGGLAYLLIVIGCLITIGMVEMSPLFYVPLSIVIGFSFASLGFLGHEILHGTVVRKPWLRDFLGAVAFWPLSTGPKLWRKWHNLSHHVHTQHEEEDPDSWPTFDRIKRSRLLCWVYKLPLPIRAFFSLCSLSFQFTVHSLNMFATYVKEFNPKKRPAVFFEMILPWMTWIGLLVWVGPVKWLFMFLIPLLIANVIVMAYISTNHRLNPTTEVNDPLANSLTVTVPKWVDVLHFNFSYHTEHHLFPGMSSKYYPLVKNLIKEKWPERYHEMRFDHALIALWKTPRPYYNSHGLIDPSNGNVYGTLGHGLQAQTIKEQLSTSLNKSKIEEMVVNPNKQFDK
ncbi:fatty acid desaturase [Halalkalibacter wakoensis JCM 9140]|uniref:Fatty acid desaturase n=1 Tax=Halalkalibacter wakoensis JCM 9140 TaxID=1236970 RepID=W4PZI4_9BACI|nr:acyl-CoA desaturase [Halalkalibacter wakoensis]GAE24509.1 fatty acid desaturase [Halalkalibacter wakoensis JCM 9140]